MATRRSQDARRSSWFRRSWRLADDILNFEPVDFDRIWDYYSETTLASIPDAEVAALPGHYESSNETLYDAAGQLNEKKEQDEEWHLTEDGTNHHFWLRCGWFSANGISV